MKHYTLDDEDIEHIHTRRRPENQLVFALQLCAFRYSGRLLKAGEVIPESISRFVAAQLGLKPDDLLPYAAREKTRREHLDTSMRAKLDRLLTEDMDGRVSRFIWLRQFEVGKNSADMNRQLDRLEFLQQIARPPVILDDIPAHRIVQLRRQGERYFTDGLRDITSDRRLAILATCIVEWSAAIADTVVETHDRIVGSIWQEAKRICNARVAEAQSEITATLVGFETLARHCYWQKAMTRLSPVQWMRPVVGACWENLVVNAGTLGKTVKADALAYVEKGYHRFKLYAPRMLAALGIACASVTEPLLAATDVIRDKQDIPGRSASFLKPQ